MPRLAILLLGVALAGVTAAPVAAAPSAPERCGKPIVAGGQPALVAVVIDGITSREEDTGTADPLGVANWCPATPAGGERHYPRGLEWGLRVWAGFTTGPGVPHTAACLPQGGLDRGSCLVKALADRGAVILPFSYTGSSVTRGPGGSSFAFKGYTSEDTLQPPSVSIGRLESMLASIQAAWPAARVIVVAHSYGGVLTEAWWRKHRRDDDRVDRLFALDSPINGVPLCPLTAFIYGAQVAEELCRRWFARDELNRQALALDVDNLFVPIAAPNDPAYNNPIGPGGITVSGGGGLRAELLYRCPDSGADPASPCIAPPSVVARDPACDAAGPGLFGRTGHHLVIACPAVVRRIAAAADPGLRVAPRCRTTPVSRPATIALGCRRTAARVRKLRWSAFGAPAARGTGTLRGRRVRVVLARPRPCDAAHRFVYTRLRVERRGRVVARDRPRCGR